ncbi:MAG: ABC-F family ATP-binding cassette domain-containing protein [Planctomycetota bacterium]|nr:ABC-F family ATP-binding cassette domain-containing protein [Planctomycetota bacterium]
MPTLLTARDLAKSYPSNRLFEGVGFHIEARERLGLIGPNGAGKSTLLKILAGLEQPDSGELVHRSGLVARYVPQDDIFPSESSPLTVVMDGLLEFIEDDVERRTKASIALSKLGFENVERPVGSLSGGWRKRLSLACALAAEPELIFLDEPTNHLDMEGVVWLEGFVRQTRAALVFITHDRVFLEHCAERIVELAPAYPGGTFEAKGNYTEFLRRKEQFLEAQAQAEATLANKVRRDTAWLRQGIQGRQTRNKTQVEQATRRRSELKATQGRNQAPEKTTEIDFQATERKTKRLVSLHSVCKSMGGKLLFKSLDLVLTPGQRLGLLGINGSGKTTLLRLISGDLEPDRGTVKRAADLRTVVFSQHRGSLDPKQTLQEALCPVGDTVDYRGRMIHVTGWARKFLFEPEQLSTRVELLSGGEQARLLIANLMLEPADVLLLDEPTNDLDIPSLEVLEEAMLEFPGALVLVTHDRFMFERVTTELIGLDGEEGFKHLPDLNQWFEHLKKRKRSSHTPAKSGRKPQPAQERTGGVSGRKKLGYMQQREFDGMEDAILRAEEVVESLQLRTSDPEILADHARATELFRQLDQAHSEVRRLYERWEELEALQGGSSGS